MFNERRLKEELGRGTTVNMLHSCIEFIRKKSSEKGGSLLRRQGDKNAYLYEITSIGISYVQDEIRRKGSPISYMFAIPDFDLEEVAGIDSDFMTPEERHQQNEWTPLELDRESKEYKEAVTETERAIEAIEADNGFAAKMPEQRAGILQALKDGLLWLKERSPSRSQVTETLIKPFRWLATTFGQSIIGEVAKSAARKIIELLAISN